MRQSEVTTQILITVLKNNVFRRTTEFKKKQFSNFVRAQKTGENKELLLRINVTAVMSTL